MLSRDELRDLFDGLAGLPYGGEVVDQRTHALQTAAHAAAADADDELILAAAFHDIGRARPVAAAHRGMPHEQAGAAFARDHLTDRSAWAIEQHVAAKRYLVTVDPAYHDTLSPVSVRSLRAQGGPMSREEAAAFEAHPWSPDAIALRQWDDAAKDPQGPVLPMNDLIAAYERVMTG
ncbi:HD domain-containing protein [Nonomuraea sp. K274]|uniref:HD domain-containing protein n=1 Tax=Nonomuraea cypriaca TaxID=1187855 RepID=A0A931AFX9_9ACTN|nr:HD domain-containing protein [Nonomuraea cypriaca]MBF8192222.1 HD domain-containing protein [Nonomuraea cypriaca]